MSAPSRLQQVAAAAPPLAALALFGVALDRLWLAALLALLAIGGLASDRVPTSPRLLRWAGALLGAALGGAALLISQTPPGPFPPAVLSPLSGALAGMAAVLTAGRRWTASWTAAALLVVAATISPPVVELEVWGLALGGVTLASLLAVSGALRPLRVAAFAGFAALAVAGAGAVAWLNVVGEGMLLPLFEAMEDEGSTGSGLGLEDSLSLSPRSHVPPTDRALFEVDGANPATFRGRVLDTFDGQRWTASEEVSALLPQGSSAPSPVPLTMVFLIRLEGSIPAPAGLGSVNGLAPAFTAGWLVDGSPGSGDRVVLQREVAEALPQEAAPGEALLDLPEELAAALRPLSEAITAGASGPAEKAAAIEAHLTENYEYSLSTDLRGPDHPLVHLVRDRRPAYCAYYASAMAAMLRSEGVKARLVGGFVPLETNPITGRTVVRTRDAHAWVEVWVPEQRRWVAFDPTPSREAALGYEAPGLPRALAAAVQDALLRLFVRAAAHPDEVIQEIMFSWQLLAGLGLAGVWAARGRLAAGLAWRRGSGPGVGRTDPRLWPYYRRYAGLLRRRGLRSGAAESDEELLGRVYEELGEGAGEACAAFLEEYRRARYAGGGERGLGERLERVERVLRAGERS